MKTYENWLLDKFKKTEYGIGDYILINTSKTDLPVKDVCKIVAKKNDMYGIFPGSWWIFKDAIKRKLTPEEVDDIEMKINAEKYNI